MLFGKLGRQRSALTFVEDRDSGWGSPMLDIAGSLQLLHAPHVKRRDKVLFRRIMVGGVWNGFLLGHARGEIVPCRFFGGFDGPGHLFSESPLSSLVRIRENPEFHDLIQRDKRTWPRCLLWHGWLPALGCNGGWAIGASGSVSRNEENKLGRDILHIILKVGLARRSSSLELLQANLLLIQMCGRMAVL